MARNTGKPSERAFEDYWDSLGKKAFLRRWVDLAHVRGMNPELHGIKFPAQPADYVLTHAGATSYCEVKSCSNKTSFPFSQFEDEQWKAMKQVTASGGSYVIFIHNVNTDSWYQVYAQVILNFDAMNKHSMSWHELERFTWLLM
ncbi:Holliday junction resolvase RecU [Telmatospirillum sp.]|uniref:Holliday junction resolvase RecU n=1 Tax=Telmatospirillum sp. TaxID=2079197 RepID=UPI00284C5E0C|nr:Holliday junction resolvase RecU [Telmatospirillum sp.]MDR3436473.1 Holliday junction resolvase RecU [Telmatospirillum sp.]